MYCTLHTVYALTLRQPEVTYTVQPQTAVTNHNSTTILLLKIHYIQSFTVKHFETVNKWVNCCVYWANQQCRLLVRYTSCHITRWTCAASGVLQLSVDSAFLLCAQCFFTAGTAETQHLLHCSFLLLQCSLLAL